VVAKQGGDSLLLYRTVAQCDGDVDFPELLSNQQTQPVC